MILMEPKDLYGFVLLVILVSFIIGVGVLALDKFGDSQTTSVTTTNETVAITSSTGTTAFNDVRALADNIYNGTTVWNGATFTNAGVITMNASADDGNYNVTYTHQSASATSTATDAISGEIALIATSWLGLIITIFVLAIIISMVIRSFSFSR